jgi:hypothetical protein
LIGNDIIDLSYAEAHSRCREKRFWEKVLRGREWETFGKSEINLTNLWACWAAKESAYKLERRQGRDRRFCPKDYGVDWEGGRGSGRVRGMFGIYDLKINVTADWIHAKCWSRSVSEPDQSIGFSAEGSAFSELPWTVLIREECGALSGGLYNTGPYFPVSKSHHGRFQAYVWSAIACQHVSKKTG